MKIKKSLTLFATALAAQLPLPAAWAQLVPGYQEIRRADVGSSGPMEVIQSFVEFQPGDQLPYHMHHGIEALYVIQGATLQMPNGDSVIFPTGATHMYLRDVPHGGAKVTGDTPLKIFNVFIVDKGKPLAVPVKK